MSDIALNLNDFGKDELLELPPIKESENPIQETQPLELYRQTMTRRTFWILLVLFIYFALAGVAYFLEGTLWHAPDVFTNNQWVSLWEYSILTFIITFVITIGLTIYFVSWIVILPDNIKYYLKDAKAKGKEVGPGLIHVRTFYEYVFKEVKISSMNLYVRSTVTTSLDGISLVANIRATYIVNNLHDAIFNISPFIETITNAIESKLNNVLSKNVYLDIQTKRDEFEQQLISEIQKESDNPLKPWGLIFTKVEISDIWPATIQARNMLILKLFAMLEAEGFTITKEALDKSFSDRTPQTVDELFKTYLLSRGGARPLVSIGNM